MRNLSAVIIDDEPKACRLLNSLIDEFCHEIDHVGVASKPQDGLELVESTQPDILFLDINMPEMTGFDFIEKLRDFHGRIIFTTAYSEFAIKAFKYNAFDYILKPIKVNDLIDTVKRVSLLEPRNKQPDIEKIIDAVNHKVNYKTSLAINDKGGLVFIQVADILYLEGQGNYTKIHCEKKSYLSSKTTKSIESVLDPENFVRVHRSFIVNMNKVLRYSAADGGELEMVDNFKVPVSRRKRQVLKRFSI